MIKITLVVLLLIGLGTLASAPLLRADGVPERHCQYYPDGTLHCPPVTP